MEEVEAKIRTFLKERFRDYRDEIGRTDKLDGVVDSLGLFELVTFLEEEFSLSIPNEEFSPNLFSSIETILKVVDDFRTG
jgi:acyl carrier protein